jgi:peptide chain release factor 2
VTTFDPDGLTRRRTELEEQMGAPGFWDDQAEAARVSTEHARVTRKLDSYQALRKEVDDATELLELEPELEAEVAEQVAPVRDELARLQEEALFNGEYDGGDAVVTITAGTGGTDAQDWAEMLLRMYLRWTERRGFKREVIEVQPGDEAGIKSATLTVIGDYAYGMLLAEAGVHRLVRISPFDQASRRHTSFASVFVWPELPDDVDVEIEDKDLRIDTYRSSGAGGQHVNVTDSAVRITHLPTGIVVSSQNERSQHRNRDSAMKVLKSRLYDVRLKEQQAKLDQLGGEKKDIAFGSQIRSYVLHPYQLIKDHRTKEEVGDVNRVLDGDIDGFIKAYLMKKASGTLGQVADSDD